MDHGVSECLCVDEIPEEGGACCGLVLCCVLCSVVFVYVTCNQEGPDGRQGGQGRASFECSMEHF